MVCNERWPAMFAYFVPAISIHKETALMAFEQVKGKLGRICLHMF